MTFLQDFQMVERPYPLVIDRLSGDPRALLAGALEDARVAGEHLLVVVGPADWPPVLAKAVAINLGELRFHNGCLLVAFRWEATRGASLFPVLEGDLEVAPLGAEQTQLVLRAHYDPRGGPVGNRPDRLLLHRVAEATVRAFLVHLCDDLGDGRLWIHQP
jgi:hypothetical protein